MEKLKLPSTLTSSASQARPRSDVTASRRDPNAPPPKISNRSTDVDIPLSAWSNWIPSDAPRQLRRALTADERRALEARRDELAPMVLPVGGAEEDRARLAIENMFGGFRSMRQTGVEAAATADATYRALQEFPCWAIEKACRSIQLNGVWRAKDGFGAFDRQWPPNDAEVADAVRKEASLYGDQHRSAVALLEATVETETS